MTKQRDYQLRHKAAGLCTHCSRPAVKSDLCEEHYTRHRDANRGRYHRLHPEAGYYVTARDRTR